MRLIVLLFWLISSMFLIVGNPVLAQTPDGETPAVEEDCDGEIGAAFGLCVAYCEAMDCENPDVNESSEKACDRVFVNYMNITGEPLSCNGGGDDGGGDDIVDEGGD